MNQHLVFCSIFCPELNSLAPVGIVRFGTRDCSSPCLMVSADLGKCCRAVGVKDGRYRPDLGVVRKEVGLVGRAVADRQGVGALTEDLGHGIADQPLAPRVELLFPKTRYQVEAVIDFAKE